MEYNLLVCEKIIENKSTIEVGNVLAVIAIIVSLVAIIISVVSLVQNRSLNTTNLQAIYFEKIFSDYIVIKIPQSAAKIEFTKENVLDKSYKELVDTMMNMIEDCGYYAYAKHDFYSKLKKMTIDLETKLISNASSVVSDVENQEEFKYHVHEDVMSIIELINKNYHDF